MALVVSGQIVHFHNDDRHYDTIGRIGLRFDLVDAIGSRCLLPSWTGAKTQSTPDIAIGK